MGPNKNRYKVALWGLGNGYHTFGTFVNAVAWGEVGFAVKCGKIGAVNWMKALLHEGEFCRVE
jgi:hypothetical protein